MEVLESGGFSNLIAQIKLYVTDQIPASVDTDTIIFDTTTEINQSSPYTAAITITNPAKAFESAHYPVRVYIHYTDSSSQMRSEVFEIDLNPTAGSPVNETAYKTLSINGEDITLHFKLSIEAAASQRQYIMLYLDNTPTNATLYLDRVTALAA